MSRADNHTSLSTLQLFKNGEWEGLAWWEIVPLVPVYVTMLAVEELRKDRGTVLTASLAFTTALSVVPLLSVAISLLAAFGLFDSANSSLTPYIQQLFPAFASEIATYLQDFAQTSAREIAGVGTVVLLVIGIFLFHSIEKAFNIIWNASQDRPWSKIFAFYTLITIGPVLISLSVVLSARAQISLTQFGIDTGFVDRFLPFLLAFLLFTAMNQFLPHTKIEWQAAVFGGAFTAISFEVAKWGFNLYVTEIILESYNKVYGTLGLLPLFLIWLYVVWIIVLFGAELAYCFQNLRTLLSVRAAQKRSPEKHKEFIFDPLVGMELYAPIARAFKSGEGAVTQRRLVALSGYNESVVRSVVDELESIGVLAVVEEGETGVRRLMPSKQLDDIPILPVVTTFFDFESNANSIPMAELRQGYNAVTMEVLRAESALALIPEDRELSQKYASVPPWKPLPDSTLAETSSWAEEAPPPDDELDPPPEHAEPDEDAVELGAAVAAAVAAESDVREPAPASEREETIPQEPAADIRARAEAAAVEEPAPEPAVAPPAEAAVESHEESVERTPSSSDSVPFLDIEPDASSSMEIQLGEDWEDFELAPSEAAEEAEEAEEAREAKEAEKQEGSGSKHLRETAEMEMEEAVDELGDEPSIPPPVPDES